MNGVRAGEGCADPLPHQSMPRRLLNCLTSGYPSGVRATDRYAMLASLYRTLTVDQLEEVVAALTTKDSLALADGMITDLEISAMIIAVTDTAPCVDDIRRVSARLAASGWPVARTLHSA